MSISKTVKELIEKYKYEIDNDDYVDIIADAAKIGFDYVAEFRTILKNAGINIEPFDKQFAKMLVSYRDIEKLAKEIA